MDYMKNDVPHLIRKRPLSQERRNIQVRMQFGPPLKFIWFDEAEEPERTKRSYRYVSTSQTTPRLRGPVSLFAR
jgi:hypothetical protein